jgi:putative membrane protein
MTKHVLFGAFCAAVTLIAAPALGASPDAAFATKAAQGGLAEVKLAQLAQQKSTNATVLAFAKHMIADHTPNNQKLATIMKSQGLTVPTSLGAQNQAMMTKLQALSGAAFNSSYLSGQVTAHQQMATLLQDEIANGKDPKLVAYAKSTLPTVKEHLQMAQTDSKRGSATAGAMKSSSGGAMKSMTSPAPTST